MECKRSADSQMVFGKRGLPIVPFRQDTRHLIKKGLACVQDSKICPVQGWETHGWAIAKGRHRVHSDGDLLGNAFAHEDATAMNDSASVVLDDEYIDENDFHLGEHSYSTLTYALKIIGLMKKVIASEFKLVVIEQGPQELQKVGDGDYICNIKMGI